MDNSCISNLIFSFCPDTIIVKDIQININIAISKANNIFDSVLNPNKADNEIIKLGIIATNSIINNDINQTKEYFIDILPLFIIEIIFLSFLNTIL